MKKKRLLLNFIVIGLLLSAACSLDYGNMSDDSLSQDEETPNAVLRKFSHTVVAKGNPLFRLQAERAEQFDAKREIRLFGVTFEEFSEGALSVVTQGRADTARYFTDSENAEISGNLVFESKREDIFIEGGYLYWNKTERKLTSRPDQMIVLRKSDGTALRGEGFSADVASKGFSFSGRVEGIWVLDKK